MDNSTAALERIDKNITEMVWWLKILTAAVGVLVIVTIVAFL